MTDTRLVVLLRGINLGPHNKLPMATLRALAAEVGGQEVATHAQSGNLVVTTGMTGPTYTDALAAVISTGTGLTVALIHRTAAQWRDLVAANPYRSAAAADGTKVHVSVFAEPAGQPGRAFDATPFAPDEMSFAASGSELFLHLPNGLGRSKLAEKLLRTPGIREGTVRNWNTVLAIDALLEAEQG
jgi:uncharacterized protein (DUF1697 family)